jgi:hypothetical protein
MTGLEVTSRAEATTAPLCAFWNAQIRSVTLLHAVEVSMVSEVLNARE